MAGTQPHSWDPERYLTFADERGRPFVDLISRIGAPAPAAVVDLGCGPGNLTRLLAERWPQAQVTGLDSSPEMIAAARRDVVRPDGDGSLSFGVADLREWRPDAPVDVLVSNATLQWVGGHLDLLPRLVEAVAPGGWLAFQVPGNFAEPSHEIRRVLADEAPYVAHTRGLATPASHDPTVYLEALAALGCAVDAWETTYLHVLSTRADPDPVFTWVSGTGARPTLQALEAESAGLRGEFEEELKARLRTAYPPSDRGRVLLPFRRVFVVARVSRGAR
ncbi:trans-aconitate 2-methyltransferase [Nocardioides sp.]|jgi:trans-aconitate 2-methyltransferase|uniref:trans-aconitate 2-methyltransferase n=1 Tax=Nocardioides sp. TaxID=35761 RepID=UPI0026245F2A|nr:trans-aconitate 2-methyltransferase [Nocardioides sp.]